MMPLHRPTERKEPSVMSGRRLRLLSIPAVVAASLTVGTGVAVADDDSYSLKSKVGHEVADKRLPDRARTRHLRRPQQRSTPDQWPRVVQTKFTNANDQEATAAVSAAESAYCP